MNILKKADYFYKLAVIQDAILKNRIKLIRAMINSLNTLPEQDKNTFNQIISQIREDNFNHFLSISLNDDNMVSYSTKYENIKNENKRIKTTLGRYLKRNYPNLLSNINDDILSKFTNNVLKQIASENAVDKEIKILDEYDIVDFYETNKDRSDVSSEGLGSCMSGDKACYTELYALNPNKVKLISYGHRARALLWTADDGAKILDRAYPSGSKYIHILRKWAENKGYIVRENPDQLIEFGSVPLSDNSFHNITLKHDGVFPYMDTFRFAEINDDTITVSNNSNFGDIILTKDDGSYKEKSKKDPKLQEIINDIIPKFLSSSDINNMSKRLDIIESDLNKYFDKIKSQDSFDEYKYDVISLLNKLHNEYIHFANTININMSDARRFLNEYNDDPIYIIIRELQNAYSSLIYKSNEINENISALENINNYDNHKQHIANIQYSSHYAFEEINRNILSYKNIKRYMLE